jgi:hypothetical protein
VLVRLPPRPPRSRLPASRPACTAIGEPEPAIDARDGPGSGRATSAPGRCDRERSRLRAGAWRTSAPLPPRTASTTTAPRASWTGPLAAHGPFRGPGRPHPGRPAPQHLHPRTPARRRRRPRVPLAERPRRDAGRNGPRAGVRLRLLMADGLSGPRHPQHRSHSGRDLHGGLPHDPDQLRLPAHPNHAGWLQGFAEHQPITVIATRCVASPSARARCPPTAPSPAKPSSPSPGHSASSRSSHRSPYAPTGTPATDTDQRSVQVRPPTSSWRTCTAENPNLSLRTTYVSLPPARR